MNIYVCIFPQQRVHNHTLLAVFFGFWFVCFLKEQLVGAIFSFWRPNTKKRDFECVLPNLASHPVVSTLAFHNAIYVGIYLTLTSNVSANTM